MLTLWTLASPPARVDSIFECPVATWDSGGDSAPPAQTHFPTLKMFNLSKQHPQNREVRRLICDTETEHLTPPDPLLFDRFSITSQIDSSLITAAVFQGCRKRYSSSDLQTKIQLIIRHSDNLGFISSEEAHSSLSLNYIFNSITFVFFN